MMVTYNAIRYAVWSEVWMAMQKVPPGVDPGAEALDALADYQVGDIFLGDPRTRIEAVFTLVVEASGRSRAPPPEDHPGPLRRSPGP